MHLARLDDVFVDHMVYADRWHSLLHLPFLVLKSPSSAFSSLGSSIMLEHRYESMEGLSATDAVDDYLESIQSPVFKFQLVAFAFSLPKALQLWGCLVLLANGMLLVAKYLGLRLALGFAGLSLLVILALYGTTSATHFPSEDAAIQMV
ncbi:hypothetical protein B0H13DRAFT_2005693 [Mycena leptocephala]|nr:hypothetical protein B0H13DRAFT_2005693 [Mycena leptocephala]